MIIDAHAHIFNINIIQNVAQKTGMVKILSLDIEEAHDRIGLETLITKMKESDINACLILPTANVENVTKVNRYFLDIAGSSKHIYTAGTLHPDYDRNKDELDFFKTHGIEAIKLCSFSQGFTLNSPKTIDLFDLIKKEILYNKRGFFVILDTLYNADKFFGTLPGNNTTPALLGDLVKSYPEIKFIGAHMGGLNAPFNEIREYLPFRNNFYLDTSNAAHTLNNNEFVELLKVHGPEHILFGTDWPWFGYSAEINLIERLLDDAGYSEKQKEHVFSRNIANLLDIE